MLAGRDLGTSCTMSGEGIRIDVASNIFVSKTVYATLCCHPCGEENVAAIRCRSKGNIYINLAAGRTRNSVKRLPTLHCTGSVHSSDAYILAVYVAQSLTVQMQ